VRRGGSGSADRFPTLSYAGQEVHQPLAARPEAAFEGYPKSEQLLEKFEADLVQVMTPATGRVETREPASGAWFNFNDPTHG